MNKALTMLLFLLTVNSIVGQKLYTVGKCQFFYEKEAPRQTLLINGMSVYHNGDFKVKSIEGKFTFYTCSGTVWVIFHTRKAAETSKFLGGNVQTCSDYRD